MRVRSIQRIRRPDGAYRPFSPSSCATVDSRLVGMSTLDSSSTLADAEAAYADNLGYRREDSVAKALLFAEACRLLFHKKPKVASHGGRVGREVHLEPAEYLQEAKHAEAWAAARNTNGQIKHPSFEDFR